MLFLGGATVVVSGVTMTLAKVVMDKGDVSQAMRRLLSMADGCLRDAYALQTAAR